MNLISIAAIVVCLLLNELILALLDRIMDWANEEETVEITRLIVRYSIEKDDGNGMVIVIPLTPKQARMDDGTLKLGVTQTIYYE